MKEIIFVKGQLKKYFVLKKHAVGIALIILVVLAILLNLINTFV